jgi:hypothetical protein
MLTTPIHCGGPGSIPGQSMWDLWWAKWHRDSLFSELSVFPCQFHSIGAPLIVKLGKKTAHLHHRVAQKALRLWCVRSICCGALHYVKKKMPIPVAARSEAWVYGRSLIAIAGSNPARVMDVCVLGVLCVVR